jgi:hypothetical protein
MTRPDFFQDMYGYRLLVGDRVKHFGQRYTGGPTATLVGFELDSDYEVWKAVVTPDPRDPGSYGTRWDLDRTIRIFPPL